MGKVPLALAIHLECQKWRALVSTALAVTQVLQVTSRSASAGGPVRAGFQREGKDECTSARKPHTSSLGTSTIHAKSLTEDSTSSIVKFLSDSSATMAGSIDKHAIRTLEKSAGAAGMSWARAGWCVAGGEARELAGRCEFGRAAEMSQLEPNTDKQSTATRKTKVATLDDEFALTHSQTSVTYNKDPLHGDRKWPSTPFKS